jgi:hypothetical protein
LADLILAVMLISCSRSPAFPICSATCINHSSGVGDRFGGAIGDEDAEYHRDQSADQRDQNGERAGGSSEWRRSSRPCGFHGLVSCSRCTAVQVDRKQHQDGRKNDAEIQIKLFSDVHIQPPQSASSVLGSPFTVFGIKTKIRQPP